MYNQKEMKIIGHRGARGLAHENTLASLQAALDCHVDEIEVDVRVTHDGKTVLCHDRMFYGPDGSYNIHASTYDELRRHVPDITLLSEALAFTADKAVLQIEVKLGEPVLPIIKEITAFMASSRTAPRILLSSKSKKILKQLHTALPDIPKVVIEPWSGVRASYRARQLGTKRISMRSWWLWKGFLKMMQRRGFEITPYTMNNPCTVRKWQPYIYGVITDYPDKFVSGS
jgi:glycerophosphoryl diester phosphodiesterase